MYKTDSVRQILSEYGITISSTKMQRRHRNMPVSYSALNIPDYNYFIQEETVTIINAEIPEKEFTAMADTLCEFRDLMKDPETAQLLMEARFINRLKGNR